MSDRLSPLMRGPLARLALTGLCALLIWLVWSDPSLAQLLGDGGVLDQAWTKTQRYFAQLAWDMAGMRAGLMIGATLLGFALGWFFSPAGKDVRDAVVINLLVFGVVLAVFDKQLLGWSLTTLIAVIGFCWGIGYWLGRGMRAAMEPPTTFGSSRWADAEELFARDLLGHEGIVLGRATEYDVPISYHGDRHLLTVAPTRSGKGVSHIIPNLLTYQGSALVIDPKGENTTPKPEL